MRTAIALALLGALATTPAWSEGQRSSEYQGGQSGMSGQSMSKGAQMDQQTVRQVQQALKQQGYDPGQIDGKWGSSTQQALSKFQKDQGMQGAQGELDQQTMAALGVKPGTPQQALTPEQQRQEGGMSR